MTNGFDLQKVTTALYGRIGFRQPASGTPVINGANLETRSGRYYQDFHSLVTVENIKQTMGLAGADDDKVNTHLTNLSKAAIIKCLNSVFRVKDFIEQVLLYEMVQNSSQRTIANSGLFVGYQINIAPKVDIALQINTAHLFFDSAKTFNLYVFAEGKKDPVYTKSVTTVAGDVAVVEFSDVLLNYISAAYAGSRFFVGYFQDDLDGAKAIQHDAYWHQTRVFGVQPMQAAKVGADFNRSEISYGGQPYGFNLEVSAFKDHTQSIIKNAAQFDEAIGLSVAYSVIEQILYTTQSNATERILKEGMDRVGIQLELTGAAPITNGPKIKGINTRIEQELDRLRRSFYPKPKAQVVNYACHS